MAEGIYMTEDQREIRRKKRVIDYAEKNGNIRIACRRFGIARSTFYLWRDRHRDSGDEGLKSRRRGCHHNHPNKTSDEVVEKILYLRRTYHMGPIRIVWYLQRYHDIRTSDAASIACASDMASTGFPTEWGEEPCTLIDTRNEFPVIAFRWTSSS